MAITGGIKFFDKNKADSLTGAMAIASSGDPSAGFILDRNNFTVWRSVGSDDTTTETITVTLSSSQTFNRLFLLRHNFKEFTVKYWNGFSFVNFVNVVGINGIATSGISETVYALGSSYYEFDSVTTDNCCNSSFKAASSSTCSALNSSLRVKKSISSLSKASF